MPMPSMPPLVPPAKKDDSGPRPPAAPGVWRSVKQALADWWRGPAAVAKRADDR